MKRRAILAFVTLLMFLGGCGPNDQRERELAVAQERARLVEEASKERTRSMFALLVTGVLAALGIGAALGSKARKDAKQEHIHINSTTDGGS